MSRSQGIGSRFRKVGHDKNKSLVNVLGQPILYWVLRHLNWSLIHTLLIPYHPDLARHRFEDQLRADFPKANFVFHRLSGSTRGAADTVQIGLAAYREAHPGTKDEAILLLDGDNFYTADVVKLWDGRNAVVTFHDAGDAPIYSYVKTDDTSKILEIKEKVKISDNANTGAYGFESWRGLLTACEAALADKTNMQKGEYYTSGIIAAQVAAGGFVSVPVPTEAYHCLGTPLHVRNFCNAAAADGAHGSRGLRIPRKRYCFDLENTLMTFPKVAGDYSTTEPIGAMVEMVQHLKALGHHIIIYAPHSDDFGGIAADVETATLAALARCRLPYDEICFGKPRADLYVDARACSAFANIEHESGFYLGPNKPRAFNRLSHLPERSPTAKPTPSTGPDASPTRVAAARRCIFSITPTKPMSFLRKQCESPGGLAGEIYWYNHTPVELKDIAPLMASYDVEQQQWYDMEHVAGVTLSRLHLSGELLEKELEAAMCTLSRIHKASSLTSADGINIYDNYARKMTTRYLEHREHYDRFPGSAEVYRKLLVQLELYEAEDRGHCTVIHGDPVMTNLLVDSLGKIKVVDMRGCQGEIMTVYGDRTYDWAKVYQSLLGYDEVCHSRMLTEQARNQALALYSDLLAKVAPEVRMDDVKLICQSLFFTLLPLHQGPGEFEKCKGYFALIGLV